MKPLTPNAMIQGRYLIVQLIGKGGMGEVYLAVDQRLGSAVALKRTFFSENEELGNAFEREARILARLRHPVLPKVIDHFSENGDQFLVMEHISGDDLSKRLETSNKPFPLSWVMFWADQMLDALNYLHSHEPPIVHRDIKPQNLKLTDDNHIVLLDFGLSKDFDSSTTGGALNSASVAGYSPHFASMEQIRGTGTDARSDIYSLSATLYQLLTNTIPVDVLTRADVLLGGSEDPIVPISQINPEVNIAISEVILKGIGVRQEQRFANALEMQRTLRRAFNRGTGGSSDDAAMSIDEDTIPESPMALADVTALLPQVPRDTGGIVAEKTMPPTASRAPTEEFKQSEVKTEIFKTDSPNKPDEPASPSPAEITEAPPPAETREISAEPTLEVAAAPPPAETREISTTPTAEVTDTEIPVATREMAAAAAAGATAANLAAAPARSQPEKSSKMGMVIGVLVGLFVLTAAAAGGGWYVYSNYYAAAAQPSPSPTPNVIVSASPIPTVVAETDKNDNTNTVALQPDEGNTNETNTNRTVVTAPPSTGPADTKQGSQATTKPNPTNPAKPGVPPAKAAPKPKPRDDRTVILQ